MNDSEFIARLGSGRLEEDLQEACLEVAQAVVRTGKKGSVTVTLEFEQSVKGDIGVNILEKIVKKPPVEDARGAMLYVGADAFHRDNPMQDALVGFREVDKTTGEIRETPGDDAAVRKVGGRTDG